jgi:hypothetical protein
MHDLLMVALRNACRENYRQLSASSALSFVQDFESSNTHKYFESSGL